jgi:hypothetical protein
VAARSAAASAPGAARTQARARAAPPDRPRRGRFAASGAEHEGFVPELRIENDLGEGALGHARARGLVAQESDRLGAVRSVAAQREVMRMRLEDAGIAALVQHLRRAGGGGLEMARRDLRVIDIVFEAVQELLVRAQIVAARGLVLAGMGARVTGAKRGDLAIEIEQVGAGFDAQHDLRTRQKTIPVRARDAILPTAGNVARHGGAREHLLDVVADRPLLVAQPAAGQRLDRATIADVEIAGRRRRSRAHRRGDVACERGLDVEIADEGARIDLLALARRDAGEQNVEAARAQIGRKQARADMLVLLHQHLDAVEGGEAARHVGVDPGERGGGVADRGMHDQSVERRQVERRRQRETPLAPRPHVEQHDLVAAERLPGLDALDHRRDAVRIEIGDQQQPRVAPSEGAGAEDGLAAHRAPSRAPSPRACA